MTFYTSNINNKFHNVSLLCQRNYSVLFCFYSRDFRINYVCKAITNLNDYSESKLFVIIVRFLKLPNH